VATAGDASNTISGRYTDAYSIADSNVSWGNMVKTLGIVAGVVIALAGFLAGGQFGVGAVVLFLVLAAAVGSSFYMFGVMIAAQGQVLRAVLGTAVNTSPLLSTDQKRDVITHVAASTLTAATDANQWG